MTTNADLLSRRNQAVARGVASMHPLFAARAANAEVWDVEGKRYIDFAGGIVVHLNDVVHGVRNGVVETRWSVAARGREAPELIPAW